MIPMPLVSVIIRCREERRIDQLKEAIRSVRDQSFQDWEIILVHDGNLPIFEEFAATIDDPRFHYHAAGFVGRAAALNAGIRLADGYYMSYLDDDDHYIGQHLETLVSAAMRTGARFVHGTVGTPPGPRADARSDFERLLGGNMIFNCVILMERSLFYDVGLFDEELKVMEDWDMWLRIAAVTPIIALPIPVATVSPGEQHHGRKWDDAKARILAKWGVAG